MGDRPVNARIRAEREHAGLTVAHCARAVSWPPSWWAEMESGKRPIYADHLAVIAAVLGVTCARLLGEQALALPALKRRGRRRHCRSCHTPIPCTCPEGQLVGNSNSPTPTRAAASR